MPKHPRKTELIVRMLRRTKGATMAQLQSSTGWQPHSLRAAMTKLRHAGHEVDRRQEGTTSRYYLTEPGQDP